MNSEWEKRGMSRFMWGFCGFPYCEDQEVGSGREHVADRCDEVFTSTNYKSMMCSKKYLLEREEKMPASIRVIVLDFNLLSLCPNSVSRHMPKV